MLPQQSLSPETQQGYVSPYTSHRDLIFCIFSGETTRAFLWSFYDMEELPRRGT